MAIQIDCSACGRRLQIDEEHAGRQARCPSCQALTPVPMASPQPSGPQWLLRTPEGQTYGPTSKQEMDDWVRQGRISADCTVGVEDESLQGGVAWRHAGDLYPALLEGETSLLVAPRQGPAIPIASTASSPVVPSTGVTPPRGLAPHRGGLIITLGILSWALGCPVFGIIAWVMGNGDLHEMQEGHMDPRGQGMTQAGLVLGMIHSLIFIVAAVIAVFAIAFYAAAG